MNITRHGNDKEPFFKGVSAFNNPRGKPMVFFGYTRGHCIKRENDWIREHADELNQSQKARPALRLVEGGRKV